MNLAEKRDRLLNLVRSLESCLVAYSGGVDSAVAAQAARLALGDRAIAITGVSASLAAGELDAAKSLARQIGIEHRLVNTQEFGDAGYLQNAPDRCYHCKTELFTRLEELRRELDVKVIVSGTNRDDLGDYRPGLTAAAEHHVRSPLAECDLSKEDVRELAREWNLPVWDKPASPCLSSRVAYGEEVTPQRLAMIDAAEQYLRSLGLRTVRVRYHRGDLARIEAPAEEIVRLASNEQREELLARMQSIGFRFITLDLAGFRSGSLNALVQLAQDST